MFLSKEDETAGLDPPPHAPVNTPVPSLQSAPCQNDGQIVPVIPQKVTPPPPPPPVELLKDQPKYVPGMLALCGACGYLSEDFNKCMRCQRKLPENVKAIPATIRANQKKDPPNQHKTQQVQHQPNPELLQQQQSGTPLQNAAQQQGQSLQQTQTQPGKTSVTPSGKFIIHTEIFICFCLR